jgi:predicted transcriptional regulator
VETVIADITASDIVVITMSKDGTTYALTSANGSSAAPTAVVVTVNGDKLAAEPIDELKWNIATSGTGYIIYPNGINNKYLYCTNTNNGVRVGTGDAKVFTINSGYLYTTQTADARHIGVYNAQDWRCYKPSSGAIASNIYGQTLKFY